MIREDEEKGLCSAALRELWRIVKDQIEERTVVVVAMGRNSTIWRKVSLRSVMRDDQLKYVDAERMRVITNSQHVAEQIKIDNSESIVMDELKIKEAGRIEKQQNLKGIVMDGVKLGKVGKLENCKINEKTCRRSEDKLCKSIMKGLARRNQKKHTMLANAEEEQEREQNAVCFDDVTGKELPWRAVRKARE